MVGIAFNPDNCAFIANQALNTNQFNGNVPDSSNPSTHTVLWDFIEEKLYWVNTQNNIIEHELPGANACDFIADIELVEVGDLIIFTCNPINGTAPYTYQWSLESGPSVDFAIVGGTTAQTLSVGQIESKPNNIGLLKCAVTDANGCKTTASFLAYIFIPLG